TTFFTSADGSTPESMTATTMWSPVYLRGRRASVPSRTFCDRYDVSRLLTRASVEMLMTSGSRAAARSALADNSATKRSGVVEGKKSVVDSERWRRRETRGPAAGTTLISARIDVVVGC